MSLIAGAPAAAAAASPVTALVVLGDSLSDSGNAGRFSNGPVWVEHLAQNLGLELRPAVAGGSNFAVGGARIEGGMADLGRQLRAFLAQRSEGPDPEALHVVYGGGNDVLALLGSAGPDGEARAHEAALALARLVDAMATAGAVRLLVPNLPDVGLAPAVHFQGPAARAEARRLTLAFNAALEPALAALERRHGIEIVRLDVFALAERLIADPAAAGFHDVVTPCRGGPCEGFLFWDLVHPTSAAHARLGAAALAALRDELPVFPAGRAG
jgi:outer membrane lipase/esterase